MSFLVTDVRVFDGTKVTEENGYVLIQDGYIQSIATQIPPNISKENCTYISGEGCTLLPGLIDSHVHVYNDAAFLAHAFRFGITTVLDMHNEPHWFREMEQVSRTRHDIPDIKSACYAATVRNGWPSAIIRLTDREQETEERIARWPDIVDVASAEAFVSKNIEAGASFIKLMQESGRPFNLPFPQLPVPTPSKEVQKAIVDATHRSGMITVGHALSIRDTVALLEAGVDGLAHACCERLGERELELFFSSANKPFIIPTLAIHASAGGEETESREFYSRDLNADDKARMCECLGISNEGFSMKNAAENVRLLKAKGLEILCGTDSSSHLKGVFVGASLHHELWLYVHRCGFTPIEALRSATSTPSRIFNLPDRGRIASGLKADLVMVRGDPTVDIECTRDIVAVFRDGVISKPREGI